MISTLAGFVVMCVTVAVANIPATIIQVFLAFLIEFRYRIWLSFCSRLWPSSVQGMLPCCGWLHLCWHPSTNRCKSKRRKVSYPRIWSLRWEESRWQCEWWLFCMEKKKKRKKERWMKWVCCSGLVCETENKNEKKRTWLYKAGWKKDHKRSHLAHSYKRSVGYGDFWNSAILTFPLSILFLIPNVFQWSPTPSALVQS